MAVHESVAFGRRFRQWEIFGTPRGPGLATATTSAAFFPHLDQRIRSRLVGWKLTLKELALRCVGS
jgi:hypothetical protein